MEKDIAIRVENVSKTFKIPHEKVTTLKGAFVSALKSKGYEEFKALDDVSFEVKKGEFFGIIGRNGSGKSTLLKILAGIYQPDAGKTHVNGLISPFLELGIGFNPELSGRDNVYLNAAVLGLTHKQIGEKFDDIVEFSELRRFIDQKVKNYSSGMQVRLAFSVAIHANRDILLMDEVLAVGDTNFQSKCIEEFVRYRQMGKTVILVSHDVLTIQKYCDRALLLREGKMQIIGKPDLVIEKYIHQNMYNEKISLKEKGQCGNIAQNKEAKRNLRKESDVVLTKVELLDRKFNLQKHFYSGSDVVVRMHYKNNSENIKKAVFGIEIFSEADYELFGFNTSMRKEAIDISKKTSFVDFILRSVPLNKGIYPLTLAIADENCGVQFYFWKKAINLIIADKENNQYKVGNLNINVEVDETGGSLAGC
jgi:ABC-type polysaccharide/polyol phosphate transport system ATPase subunit